METTLLSALRDLRAALGPLRVAPLYRSAPISALSQPDYLNTAAVGSTGLPPEAVLAVAKLLELRAGRRRGPRHGPRPLDIDLLLYGTVTSSRPELILPHPWLARRRFALAPLADLAPDWRVPPDGRTVAAILAAAPEQGLERVAWAGGAATSFL